MEERRQHQRVKVQFTTIYGLFQSNQGKVSTVQKGEIQNISLGGFLLFTESEFLQFGDNIYFKFTYFLEDEQVMIQGRGDVVWQEGPRAGIRFSSIDADSYHYIREMVKEGQLQAE